MLWCSRQVFEHDEKLYTKYVNSTPSVWFKV